MSSFSTAGGGQKAATLLLPGRRCYYDTTGQDLETITGAVGYSYTSGSPATAVNVTGRGALTFSLLAGNNGLHVNNNVTITIDGVEVLNDTVAGSIENSGMLQVGNLYWGISVACNCSYESVPFNKSLVISVSSDFTTKYYYNYYLT